MNFYIFYEKGLGVKFCSIYTLYLEWILRQKAPLNFIAKFVTLNALNKLTGIDIQ
jgi:hypothetical protein